MMHWLHTTSTEPVPWCTIWMDHVLPLRELLVIALGRPCPIESLQLTMGDTEVTALFRTVDHGQSRRPRSVAIHNFLVTAAELPGGFEAAVNRWYDLELAHRVAVRSLTDTLRSAERLLPDRITGLVRVIGPLVDKQQKVGAAETADLDYQLWLDKVEAEIADADIRAAVLAKLKNKPNANDNQRLKVIATDLGTVGAWLSGGDIDGFAKRVVASRVAASHPSSKRPKNAISGVELLKHTLALSWMLRCAVLARLGVPLTDLRDRARDGGAQPAVDPPS